LTGTPLVSVIIIERNVREYIRNCLNSILNQTYKNIEIIVCDGNSMDGTKEIIQNEYVIKGVKLLVDEGKGPGVATNLAIRYSKGEIIAFTFGDEEASPQWIEKILEHFNDRSVYGVFGPVFFKKNEKVGLLKKFGEYKLKRRWLKGYHDPKHLGNTNCAYRRKLFEKIGYFNENTVDAYDSEFSYRVVKAGYKLVFEPESIVYHQVGHEESITTYLTAIANVNFGYGQATYIHGIRFAPSVFLISVMSLIYIIALALLPFFQPIIAFLTLIAPLLVLIPYTILECIYARDFIPLLNLFYIPIRLIIGSVSFFMGYLYESLKTRNYESLAMIIRRVFDFMRLKWD
jgi:glycosyltransferase involved in cell wall biosynthesis